MSDRVLRTLERQAAEGNPIAQIALLQEKIRIGQMRAVCPLPCPEGCGELVELPHPDGSYAETIAQCRACEGEPEHGAHILRWPEAASLDVAKMLAWCGDEAALALLGEPQHPKVKPIMWWDEDGTPKRGAHTPHNTPDLLLWLQGLHAFANPLPPVVVHGPPCDMTTAIHQEIPKGETCSINWETPLARYLVMRINLAVARASLPVWAEQEDIAYSGPHMGEIATALDSVEAWCRCPCKARAEEAGLTRLHVGNTASSTGPQWIPWPGDEIDRLMERIVFGSDLLVHLTDEASGATARAAALEVVRG